MPYELILDETEQNGAKDVGDNVFLANLPADFPVYAFYYPAEMPDDELETLLRKLGDRTGTNLFVNIGRLNDPQFDKLVRVFQIKSFPSVIMTARGDLAGSDHDMLNAYVKLDGRLLANPERAIKFIEGLYLLFLKGDVAKAIRKAGHKNFTELARTVGKFVLTALTQIGTYIVDHDFSVSLVQGRFEVKKSA
jgi:hypothetical protein